MNRRDSDERRWDPGRAGQVGRHLARRLHWRGETPSCSPHHRHPSAAASQTAPLSRRREETSSSVHATTQGNKHRQHQWHQSWWAARCGGRKQTTGGSGRRAGAAVAELFLHFHSYASARVGRDGPWGEGYTTSSRTSPPPSHSPPRGWRKRTEINRRVSGQLKCCKRPRKAVLLMLFTGWSRVTLWLLKKWNKINSNK